MPPIDRKNIIKHLMSKAKKEVTGTRSGFASGFQATETLVYTWISFEAFSCLKYQLGGARDRINEFCNDFGVRFTDEYEKLPDMLKRMVIGLKSFTVKDMTPGSNRRPIKINDVKNLSQVMDVIYRVRCNLFHGGKDMNEVTDIALVNASGIALYYILEKFLTEEGYL